MDFNSSEGNNTRVAHLDDASDALVTRELNILNAEQVDLYLFSTLQEGVGSVHGFEIAAGGTGYTAGDRILLSQGMVTDLRQILPALMGKLVLMKI